MTTAVEVRRHIEFKRSVGEIKAEVADRMLAALDDGAAADYALLFEAATFLPIPARCYHTAPTTARSTIMAEGLRATCPEDGTNWGANAPAQPSGVYVAADPDEIGMWSHAAQWDVWEVDTSLMNPSQWSHDRLNPGCWRLHDDVPVERVRHWGTRGVAAT